MLGGRLEAPPGRGLLAAPTARGCEHEAKQVAGRRDSVSARGSGGGLHGGGAGATVPFGCADFCNLAKDKETITFRRKYMARLPKDDGDKEVHGALPEKTILRRKCMARQPKDDIEKEVHGAPSE